MGTLELHIFRKAEEANLSKRGTLKRNSDGQTETMRQRRREEERKEKGRGGEGAGCILAQDPAATLSPWQLGYSLPPRVSPFLLQLVGNGVCLCLNLFLLNPGSAQSLHIVGVQSTSVNEQIHAKRRKNVQGTERKINSLWGDVRNCLGWEVIFEVGFRG